MIKYGMPMLAPSGYIAQTDKDLCNKCGACIDVCAPQVRSLVRDEKKGAPPDVRVLTKKSAH